MSFAAPGFAVKDQGAALGDEVRSQIGSKQRLPQSRLQCEIELINGLEEGKVSLAGAVLQAGFFVGGASFRHPKGEENTLGPVLFFRCLPSPPPNTSASSPLLSRNHAP